MEQEILEVDNGKDESPPPEDVLVPKRYRAKLYRLDEQGKWNDLGTGNFGIVEEEQDSLNPGDKMFRMSLLSEGDNNQELLEQEYISADLKFDRQRCK